MDAQLLTDWITIAGAGSSPVTQPSTQWLDVPEHEDIVFFLEVKEVAGTVTLAYETSATRDDGSFVALVAPFALAVTTVPRTDAALLAYAEAPLARFVRWRLTGAGTPGWDAVFRVWVAACSSGGE